MGALGIDSHNHFWHYNPNEYDWISDDMKVLKQNFLPSQFKQTLFEAGMQSTVAVQARQSMEETHWLLDLAAKHDFIKGVVGWVDLCTENIEEILVNLSSYKKLVGLRHVVQDEPNDYFIIESDFKRGISFLSKFGLVYDLLIFPKHLKVASQLVKLYPEQTFVLDHIAKPDIKNGVVEPWAEDIKNLAQNPNVYCKLSGMVTEGKHNSWKYEDFVSYFKVVVEAFGVNRLMVGSDWPVCLLAGDYQSVMSLTRKYFEDYTEDVKEKIFGKTCAKVYGLEVSN